jgi:hypothetical protein
VTVTALPVPKVTLEASSDRALPGGSVQLTWRSEDATSCTASGAPFTGTKPTSGTERLNELTKGTKTFKVTCKGVGGSGSADVKVAVVAKPTLTFSASKTQIAENTGTQLKWKATDATNCLASDDWNGPQGLSGSFNTGNLSSDKTYTLTCTGLNGEVEQTVKVQVVGAPRVTLNVSDGIVAPGESVTLNWSVEDAQSCTASGSPFTGSKNPAGASETLSNLTKGAKTFKLTCRGGGGTTSAEAKLTVIAPPTLTFSASKTQLAENTGTQLRWKATDATSCLASGDWSGSQGTSGTVDTGNLSSDKTYTLTCTGLNGEVAQTAKVEVVAAPRVTLNVSDDIVAPGESVTMTWSVEDAQSCSASGAPFTGTKNIQGSSETLSNLTKGAKTFKLTCRGASGTTAAEAKLTVIAKPTLTFSASKTQIAENAGTQLKWRATDATSCLASGDWSGSQGASGSFDTGTLTSDKTYTLTCIGLNGEVEQTVKVEVVPAPTVSLSLSDTLVEPGTAVTLSWESEYAQSCTASGGGWSGSRTLSGTETVTFTTPNKRVFTLTCRGVGGPKTATVELGVFPRPKILSFTADSTVVQAGKTTTLKWQTQDTSACTATGAWTGPQARNSAGTASPELTQRTNVLTLTCRGDGGETSASVTVEAQGAPEVTLSVDRTLITAGENATLTWSSTEATSCTASGAWSGTKALAGTEASNALEPGNYTFTLRCSNAVGSETKSVSIESARPQVSVDLNTLAFGDTGVGVTPRRSLKVTNTGKVPLTGISAMLGGANADQFALTSNCAATLAPNAACSIEVTFRPTSSGAKDASLEIKGAGANPLVIVLSGTAAFQVVTVSKTGPGSGTVTSNPAGIECGSGCNNAYTIGTTVTLTARASEGSIFTGWSGACSGLESCVVTMREAKSVVATFAPRPAAGVISGRWSGTDSSRPAYISVSSAADDSFLKVVTVASDGSFEVSGLDPSKEYLLEPEQSGTKVVSSQTLASAASANQRMSPSAAISGGAPASPLALAARPGDYINFLGEKIPGLTENEFVYRWEGNPTASGAEYSSYVNEPIKVELIPDSAPVADPQAAIRLAEEYGILLVNPKEGSPADQMVWTSEYADRLLKMLKIMPLPVASEGARGWSQLTYVELVNRDLNFDVEKVGSAKYLGGRVQISASAFPYAAPLLARIEGKRGIFFSNRLFRAVTRMVTEDGTRRDVIRDLMTQRYGITVATDDNDALLITPVTCPSFPSDCEDAEWKVFNPEEFFDLLSILEEFPEGMRDFSQPGKAIGLRHLLRRRDGVPHPLYKEAGAVAWPEAGYAEFMENGLVGTRASRHSLIVHEKAHFLWAGLLSSSQRYDWLRLSGWYQVPKLEPGTDVKAIGKCDQWRANPGSWVPPNVTNADAEFAGAVRHDENNSDEPLLKGNWASCSSTQFVSPYAARINPNEDFAESISAFLLNPDLLRSRALPKYEFIRDRLMQGSLYISKIREDLTFEVFNLYPDYTYPGKIKSIDIRVEGGAKEDKRITFRISLHVSENCDSVKNPGCFQGASRGGFRVFSRVNTFYDVGLFPVTPAGDVLEGVLTIGKHAAAGWWQVVSIVLFDAVGNSRISKQSSKDFGWKLYINNPLEDLDPPEYIKNSLKMEVVSAGDPRASSAISGDEREMIISWRVRENIGLPDWWACYSALSYDDSFGSGANGQRVFKGSSESYGNAVRFLQPQADMATHECTARHRMTRYWTAGAYYVPYIEFVDLARQGTGVRFSFKGKDKNIEVAPEYALQTTNSDAIPPVLNIAACKSADLTEKCLRVSARPTNPQSPDGETIVDIYYWAYEDQPLSNASGFDGGGFQFRDPQGKTFDFALDSGTSAGVVDRSPSRLIDGNVYFSCPKVAPVACTAVTEVQYQARVILPVGSAPGTWGLTSFVVGDKVRNGRGYDFTELFRFDPTSSASGRVIGASDKGAASSPFTFKVGESSMEESATIAAASDTPTISLNLIGSKPSDPRVADSARSSSSRSGSGEGGSSSSEKDPLTGSEYRIVRKVSERNADPQRWQVEYRANNDELLAEADLPETSRVIWRRATEAVDTLATGGDVALCSDQVWTVQDGYRLITHRFDKSLTAANQNDIEIARPAEVSLVTDVGCGTGGAVNVSGFVFGVSDTEPPLSAEPVPAHRFDIELNRSGEVTRKTLTPTEFVLPAVCASPKNELAQFCTEAKRAVGW